MRKSCARLIDPSNGRIRTVLFDVDGTLLDTKNYILSAFEDTAYRFGFVLPTRVQMTLQIGRPLEVIYGELAPETMVSDLIESHRTFQEDNLHLVRAFQGTEEVLGTLRDRGMALAVVTSRSRRTSVASLEIAGIGQFFRFVVSAEDTAALKPDPAPLRAALAMLNRSSSGAVMVGDTIHDIHAGHAIGIPTVAVLYGFGGESVLAAAPSVTIANIADLPAAIASLSD